MKLFFKCLSVFCFSFFCLLGAFAAVTFPVTLPSDDYNNGQAVFGEENVYKVQLVFELSNAKMTFNDGGYLALPVPNSTSHQKVTVTSVEGIAINDIFKDIYGNAVLFSSEIKPHTLPQNVKIRLEVTTFHTKINKNMTPNLSLDIAQSIASDKMPTKDEIFKLANDYRDFVNKKAIKPKNRIYHEKVAGLYPIEDKVYYDAMVGFLSTLAENGITSSIVYGWNVPDKVDYIARDFAAQIYSADGGVILLNKNLKQYSSDGTHIWWNALPVKYSTEYDDSFLYVGVANKTIVEDKPKISNKLTFINATVFISIGKVKGANAPDDRFNVGYDRVFVTPKSKNPTKMLSFGSRLGKSSDSFVLLKAKKSQPQLKQQPAKTDASQNSVVPAGTATGSPLLKSVTLCRNVENGKAVMPTTIFSQYAQIFVFFEFKPTNTAKTLSYKWINSNGNVHLQNTATVQGNWSSYYTYINSGKKALQRGSWKLEVTVNGVLAKTAYFTVQ